MKNGARKGRMMNMSMLERKWNNWGENSRCKNSSG